MICQATSQASNLRAGGHMPRRGANWQCNGKGAGWGRGRQFWQAAQHKSWHTQVKRTASPTKMHSQ